MNSVAETLHKHFVPSAKNAYRPHVLRGSWLVFFLALVLVAEGFLVSNLITRQSSTTFLAAVLPAEVITLTNTQRIQNKVGTVTENTVLDAAATAKAQDMAAKGYFSHIGPDGKEPWAWIQGAGYDYQYAGENLAVRFVDSKDVVNAWMASPTHRANMVKASYTQIGVGVAQGMYQGQQATFVVQYFASPATKVLGDETGPSAAADVQGASTIMHTLLQSVVDFLQHVEANPRSTTSIILYTVVGILLVALVLTFFVHIQIQPVSMLIAGSLVTAFTLSIIVFNSSFLSASFSTTNSASVAEGSQNLTAGLVIDSEAAQTSK
jgi:hypothetical protein